MYHSLVKSKVFSLSFFPPRAEPAELSPSFSGHIDNARELPLRGLFTQRPNLALVTFMLSKSLTFAVDEPEVSVEGQH